MRLLCSFLEPRLAQASLPDRLRIITWRPVPRDFRQVCAVAAAVSGVPSFHAALPRRKQRVSQEVRNLLRFSVPWSVYAS